MMKLLRCIRHIVDDIENEGGRKHAKAVLARMKVSHSRLFERHCEVLVPAKNTVVALQRRRELIHGKPQCEVCGKECGPAFTRSRLLSNLDQPWPKYCSKACAYASPERARKTQETCLQRYGSSSPLGSAELRTKGVETFRRRCGGTNCMHDPRVRKKIHRTNLKRYGHVNPVSSRVVQKRMRDTCRERYGVDFPLQCDTFLEKQRATNLERRGVEYPMQNAESFALNREGRTNVVDMTYKGIIYNALQGYEPQVIRLLVDIGYTVRSHILQEFWYVNIYGVKRRYYPDLIAKNQRNNRVYVIEVKSWYTAGLSSRKAFDVVCRKAEAVIKSGRRFVLIVYEPRRNAFTVFPGLPDWRAMKECAARSAKLPSTSDRVHGR